MGHTFLTVVRMTRCSVKKLMSASWFGMSVSSCLYHSLTLISKTFISSSHHFAVNLIVGWKALSVSIDYFKESSACSHMKNAPSVYLQHLFGCSSMSSKILSSRSVISITAYGGANVVPIDLSLNCFKWPVSAIRKGSSKLERWEENEWTFQSSPRSSDMSYCSRLFREVYKGI